MKHNPNEEKTTGENNQIEKFEKRQRKASSKKNTSDTFWNMLRVENNCQLSDLVEATGYKMYKISGWFTGKWMPSDSVIEEFCSLFGVDFDTGKLEFERGYSIFHSRDGKTVSTRPRRANKEVLDKVSTYSDVHSNAISIEPVAKTETDDKVQKITEILYGKLSYSDFMQLAIQLAITTDSKAQLENILTWAYGRRGIDVDVFIKIAAIVNS